MTPARTPMTNDAIGVTNPEAGVTATRPATAPDAAPRIVGLPARAHSANSQPSAAAAAAVFVLTNAVAASSLEEVALPALNPNHPTQSSDAPTTGKGKV